jgi:DNA-binding MarR family transcriptional regulator
MRGRPPITRNRVLSYLAKHGPCPLTQIARATQSDLRHVRRIIRAIEKIEGANFAPSPA